LIIILLREKKKGNYFHISIWFGHWFYHRSQYKL